MRTILLASLMALAIADSSRAEIRVASSVEWLACGSEAVVIGKITRIATTKGEGEVVYQDCTVQVDEVLKGDVKGKELLFCLRSLPPHPSGKDFMNSKKGVLFFLIKSKDHGPEHHLDNMYVPTSYREPLSIIELSRLPGDTYGKGMTILSDDKELLKAVRTWAESKTLHSVQAEVPYASPIHARLYAGSACFLVVPAEDKHRQQFLKMAKSERPWDRQRAAAELYKFPGDETEAALRELLQDKTENVWQFSADTISKVEFGVRTAAHGSLKKMGKPVPEIETERRPTDEERRAFRARHWQESFGKALLGGWKVLAVEDGGSRQFEGRDTTSVTVTCGEGESRCRFILIPKEWSRDDWPDGINLGVNGRNSQGARHFFQDGSVPKEVQGQLVKYFGLESPGGVRK